MPPYSAGCVEQVVIQLALPCSFSYDILVVCEYATVRVERGNHIDKVCSGGRGGFTVRYSAIRKPGGGFRKVYELGLYGSEVGVLYIYLMEQERWDAEGGRVA